MSLSPLSLFVPVATTVKLCELSSRLFLTAFVVWRIEFGFRPAVGFCFRLWRFGVEIKLNLGTKDPTRLQRRAADEQPRYRQGVYFHICTFIIGWARIEGPTNAEPVLFPKQEQSNSLKEPSQIP